MGIYIFNADFLDDVLRRDAEDSSSSHDFGKDIIPGQLGKCRLVAHRFRNSCYFSDERDPDPYWRDVGTIDAYWEANLDLTSVNPSLNLYDLNWPIWTYQAQRPAAKFVFDDDLRRGMALDSLVSAGCIVSGATVRNSLLFTDVYVHSFSRIDDSIILPHSRVRRHARLRKVVVDKRCEIPEGLVVGEDADDDARRFYRTESGVTLITQSMIDQL